MSLARSRRNEGLDPPQRRVQVPGMHGCAKLDVSAMASPELGVARAPRVLHIHGRQQDEGPLRSWTQQATKPGWPWRYALGVRGHGLSGWTQATGMEREREGVAA